MVINLNNEIEQYQYGIYHLLKMIFPYDTVVRNHANADIDLSFHIGADTVTVCFGEKKHTEPIIRDDVLLTLKRAVYRITGASLPFGVLTGVRPSQTALKFETDIVKNLQHVYFVSEEKGRVMEQCARMVKEVRHKLSPGQISLYINIPFCPSRCRYCSFTLEYLKPYSLLIDDYFTALLRELEAVLATVRDCRLTIYSIYIGGGTPTVLSAGQLDILLGILNQHAPDRTEFCVEAGRADTMTEEKLRILKQHGVSRISINPQSLNQKTLERIGRRHTVAQFYEAFALSQKIGFETVNTDLIAGLSDESFSDFQFSLDEILKLSPEHITVHTLCKKRTSQMTELADRKTEAEVKKMLAYTYEMLYNTYKPYYIYRQKNAISSLENIGFMKNGKECAYNIFMMEEASSVIAVGAGGTSKLVDFSSGKPFCKLRTEKQPERYIAELDMIIERKRGILYEGYRQI